MSDFISILDPVDEREFFSEYFEKKPFHISRDATSFFDSIISLEEIDEIIDSGHLQYPDIKLIKKGSTQGLQPWLEDANSTPSLKINRTKLYQQIAEGQTLVVNTIEQFLPKFNDFIVSYGNQIGVVLSGNVYITPPNQQGFNWHYDNHDVFVLQIKGQKEWNLIEEDTQLPDSHFKAKSPKIEEPEHSKELLLKEGDTLYIPRGMYHKAATTNTASVHVTLSINTIKAYSLYQKFFEEMVAHKPLRRSVLPRYSSKSEKETYLREVKKFALDYFSNLDIKSAEESWRNIHSKRVKSSNKNRLVSILELSNLNLESKLKLAPNTDLSITESKKYIQVEAGEKKLKYPIFMRDAVLQVLNEKTYRIKDLIPAIPEKSAIELARKFIVEGFLTVVD